MCTLVMSIEDPLSVITYSKKTLVGTDCSDTSSIIDETNENKDESTPMEPESERKTSIQLYHLEDTLPAVETNIEEQNTHRINANNWGIVRIGFGHFLKLIPRHMLKNQAINRKTCEDGETAKELCLELSLCIAVVTVVVCLMFFLYYCF